MARLGKQPTSNTELLIFFEKLKAGLPKRVKAAIKAKGGNSKDYKRDIICTCWGFWVIFFLNICHHCSEPKQEKILQKGAFTGYGENALYY